MRCLYYDEDRKLIHDFLDKHAGLVLRDDHGGIYCVWDQCEAFLQKPDSPDQIVILGALDLDEEMRQESKCSYYSLLTLTATYKNHWLSGWSYEIDESIRIYPSRF